MLAKLFQKPSQSQPPSPSPSSTQADVTQESMESKILAPRVTVHYGIPSTASVLAFDPIQCLLAVGTLDGRIKVVGGDNIEGLLLSPKALPFKNLEFLQNQGLLVSVSNENEIQVWDLEKRCILSSVQWESNITAFSVISGTSYMYVGDEYGFLSVLKFEVEEGKILHLPYHIPPNLIAGAGISLPDQQSIVGVLSQPCTCGNRVLIAYENGLIILWDVTEDKVVHVKNYKDLQLKGGTVVNFSDNESHTSLNFSLESLDNEETEKEISSLCWASPDGSILVVGYVDGDILLWNLTIAKNAKDESTQKSSNDVVKIQLSSADRRLPVIVLHCSSHKGQNGRGGQLFAYGGEEIGSEEVLTILNLDWSSGLAKLKCVERVDLTLHGSFADVIVLPNSFTAENSDGTSFFVLTNPGQLHFYEYSSLSILKSGRGKNHSVNSTQYHSVIPTVEPNMIVGRLYTMDSERNVFRPLAETVSPAKQQSVNMLSGGSTKWPLTGGVPHRMSSTNERNSTVRIYIGGYQDGSIRIWDATFPVLSLVSVLGSEINGIQVAGSNSPISAIDLCPATLTLAVGNEFGSIFLYKLIGNANQTTVTIVTEAQHETHHYQPEDINHFSTIYSILKSPVCALQFATSGVRLVAGFECGRVAVLDTCSPSVLFITDCVSSSRSPVRSLGVISSHGIHQNGIKNSSNVFENDSAMEIVFVLTRDTHIVSMDIATGNVISSKPMHPKEKATAISMYMLEVEHALAEESKIEAVQPQILEKTLAPQLLLCCEEAFYVFSLKSLTQGDDNFVHELRLEDPCSWTSLFKRDAENYGVIIVYQTGEIEIRSLPELKPLGNTSMISMLRWNFMNNMDKTMSASDKGQITVVNGREFAFVSLLASENEFRIPENLPCLHDKILAATADADVNFSQNLKKAQIPLPGFVSNMIKGLKGFKEQRDMKDTEAREIFTAHLERIFSRFPFSEPDNAYDLEDMELRIDDIDIDEPVPPVSSSNKITDDVKGKGTQREKLFEGGSTDAKPTVRTQEEIIAKYRKTGDAAGAASQAKDKLMERQEKLEKLSRRTEELQSGAQNYAEMASELAKAMEKRKWWNI